MTVIILLFDGYLPINKISAPKQNLSPLCQFSLEILEIQYWRLILACPGKPDLTHINRLNQINVFLQIYPYAKKSTLYLTTH